MGRTVVHQLIASRLICGELTPGAEIGLAIDQTLTQHATAGTMVMLELEAGDWSGCRSSCRCSTWTTTCCGMTTATPSTTSSCVPGVGGAIRALVLQASNGVSHPLHMQRFEIPDKTMIGTDSHTCAARALGMLAIGKGDGDGRM